MKAQGWHPTVTNEQAYVEGTESHWWTMVTPKRRQELAQARANAVRELLIKRGVDADRLQAVGYGDGRPLDKRPNADARAKNRRVEFIIVEQ